jgi:hypothetical protein
MVALWDDCPAPSSAFVVTRGKGWIRSNRLHRGDQGGCRVMLHAKLVGLTIVWRCSSRAETFQSTWHFPALGTWWWRWQTINHSTRPILGRVALTGLCNVASGILIC